MPRLFVALALPEEVRARLAGLAAGIRGARPVPAHQLHLTLRFIGEVTEAVGAQVEAELARASAPAFELAIRGAGAFGRPPRTLWAGVAPPEEVAALAAQVERAVVVSGLPPEERPFSPHVTLARLKGAPPFQVRDFLEAHRTLASEPFAITEVRLYGSVLSSKGAEHTVLARFPLSPRAPPGSAG